MQTKATSNESHKSLLWFSSVTVECFAWSKQLLCCAFLCSFLQLIVVLSERQHEFGEPCDLTLTFQLSLLIDFAEEMRGLIDWAYSFVIGICFFSSLGRLELEITMLRSK